MIERQGRDRERGGVTRWATAPLLWALLGFALLALAFARVALGGFTQGVVGGDGDGYNNLWNYYWLKTALLDLHTDPFYTDYIYYPTGTSLRFHTFNPVNGLFTLPFNLLFGYIPGTNLLFILGPFFTGLFSFLLIRDLVGDPRAAFVGAAIATYADYHIAVFLVVGQSSYVTLQFIPLFFFLLFRALHGKPQWRAGLGGAYERGAPDARRWPLYVALSILALLGITLTDWQLLMFTFLATALYSLYLLVTRLTWREKAVIYGRLAIIGALYAAIVTPTLLLPMVREAQGAYWLDISYQAAQHSVNLAWLLDPGIGLHGIVIGALALTGAFYALRSPRDRGTAIFWMLVALFFYLMSLGPQLQVGEATLNLPLPYTLLQEVPVLSAGRDPGRFTLLATLGMSVLAAFGARALFALIARRWRAQEARRPNASAWLLSGLALALALIASGHTLLLAGAARIDPPLWPPFYEQIASDAEDYAMLEMPIFSDNGLGADHYQMYQVLHHKPRFSGRLARDRKLDNPNNFVKRASLFRHLWMLDFPPAWTDLYYPPRDILQRTDYARQGLRILNYYKVRYAVFYKAAISEENLARMEEVLREAIGGDARPHYEDDAMRVYAIPPAPSSPAALGENLTFDVGDGWYAVEVGADGVPYRWADLTPIATKSGFVVTPTAQLYSMNLTGSPSAVMLRFAAHPFATPRTLSVHLNGQSLSTFQLRPEEGLKRVELPVTLAPGNNLIEFSSPQPAQPTGNPADARLLSFAVQQVALEPTR